MIQVKIKFQVANSSFARLLPEEHHLHQRVDPGGGQHVPDRLINRVGCLLRAGDPL